MPDQFSVDSIMGKKSTPLSGNIISTKSKLTQSKSLESEAKDLRNRRVSGVGRRCAEYRPSLDELKSTSFSDYIRGELLGVPIPGYEFLYIYEDKDGRERKREVPVGQIPPLIPETEDSVTDAGSDLLKKSEQAMMTRSQSKAIEILKKGSDSKVVPPEAYLHQPKKYQMCWVKLRDGLAKVTLPTGFWAKMDATARGRHWAKGSKLGDTVIPAPIKQALSGIGGVYEYTLLEQPPVTVAQFRTQADDYRKRHIGEAFDEDHSDDFCDDLARKFWRRLGPTMEPPTYGADMEGTLFKDAHAHGWNVDRLESCLCLLRAHANDGDREGEVFHLPGVTSAYLYFGMWASAFAAHTEDMNLLSINYLHAGAPKYWYAIAQEDSKRFESLARSQFAGPTSECPEFLRHKRCLLSPTILRNAGIKYTTCVQRPGDAVITFPGSYHFGFNTGFNVAESTNFAVPEWIPLGEAANVCMCHPHSVRIQMKCLKMLLNSYENAMSYRRSIGIPPLSYSIWAKQEAMRIKKDTKACTNKVLVGGDFGRKTIKLPTALNECVAIEITRESIAPKKGKRKRKSSQRKEFHEWRLGKKVRPGLMIPLTQVICMVECQDVDSASMMNDCEFFMATIVKLVDGYVKVHLIGLRKKNDLWLEQDSDYLFLDCGTTDPATVEICQTAKISTR